MCHIILFKYVKYVLKCTGMASLVVQLKQLILELRPQSKEAYVHQQGPSKMSGLDFVSFHSTLAKYDCFTLFTASLVNMLVH